LTTAHFRAFCRKRSYFWAMGVLLLVLAAFFIMGGFHVIGYTALLCGVLFALFILPAMVISKLLRA
jgi:hypothetical protein